MKNPIDNYIDKRAVMPLLCWDIYSQFALNNTYSINTEKNKEITQLSVFAKQFKWQNDVKTILKTNTYEALILTDVDKKIIWVSDGFTKMTGYTKDFAQNKEPVFLQGASSQEKRIEISRKLAKKIPFKDVIINYRKDGTPYFCELYIIPLKSDKVTHFLALKKTVFNQKRRN